jgi:hypothetical protein
MADNNPLVSYGPIVLHQTLKDKLLRIKIKRGKNETYQKVIWHLVKFYEEHKDCTHVKS